jgi:hypothetical protein
VCIFYYLAIVEASRSLGMFQGRDQSVPSNNYGSQSSYSNGNSGPSGLTRSSSTYGSPSNDLVLPQANSGGYYGGSNSGTGSNRYI